MIEIVLDFEDSWILLESEEIVDRLEEIPGDFALTGFDYENGLIYLVGDHIKDAKEYLRFGANYNIQLYGNLAVRHFVASNVGDETSEIEQDMADAMNKYKENLRVSALISDAAFLKSFLRAK